MNEYKWKTQPSHKLTVVEVEAACDDGGGDDSGGNGSSKKATTGRQRGMDGGRASERARGDARRTHGSSQNQQIFNFNWQLRIEFVSHT